MIKLRILLFCGYCAVVVLVPVNPHPYTFFINTTVWLINAFCYHFFRVFLSSGTPASKTIFHSLLWSLSVCYQLHSSVFAFLVLLGNLFNTSTKEFVNSHPGAACVLFTPRWTSNSMILYLFYLATLKLIIALKPYSLMQLNHERAALYLNITVIVLSIVDTGVVLLFKGSTCDTMTATVNLKITTGLEFSENAIEKSSSFAYILALLTIITLSVVEYAVAEIIVNLFSYKAWFEKFSTRISNNNNQIGEDMQINRDIIVFPNPSQSGQHIIPNINSVSNQQSLTQFQKLTNLIKRMGFFASFFFLMVCIFLIFFEMGFIILRIITIGGKLLLHCTPVYWVLVVDDVHELAKRRVAPILTSVYYYFIEGKVKKRKKERQIRVAAAPLSTVADETPGDFLSIEGSSSTDLKVSDEGPRDVFPIAGSSTKIPRIIDERPRCGHSTAVLSSKAPCVVERIKDNSFALQDLLTKIQE